MSLKFAVGDLTIHRIIEQETTFLPALEMLPGLTPELLAENRPWMQKAGALDANDVLILCFQSYVVKTPHHTILVDSCIGNDKPRPQRPKWNMKTDDTYARAWPPPGCPSAISTMSCARICMSTMSAGTRGSTTAAGYRPSPRRATCSARPSSTTGPNTCQNARAAVCRQRAAGRRGETGESCATTTQIGDHARILPTPGHTPGHVAFTFGRGKDAAVFSGDLMHSPLPTRHPELSAKFDVDQAQAAATRRGFLERYCDTDTLCCTALFPPRPRVKLAPPAIDSPARRYEHAAETPVSRRSPLEPVDEHVTVVRLEPAGRSMRSTPRWGAISCAVSRTSALDPKGLRCIVLTGTGDKAFCAGGDLKERRGMTDEAWTRQHVIFERMVRALIDCPVPIIGAVNGAAYGGG